MIDPRIITTDLQERTDLHKSWGFEWEHLEYTPAVEPMVWAPKPDLSICQHFMTKPGEWFVGPVIPMWEILHWVGGWDNPLQVVDIWEGDKRGSVATKYVVGGVRCDGLRYKYDGLIVQAFADGGYGYHCSQPDNKLHRQSIGIEVCLFGQLKDGKTYVGTTVEQSQIVTLSKPFRGHTQFHRPSEVQLKSTRELILYNAEKDNIDIHVGLIQWIKNIGAHAACDKYDPLFAQRNPGLYTHANLSKQKLDWAPIPEFIDMLMTL